MTHRVSDALIIGTMGDGEVGDGRRIVRRRIQGDQTSFHMGAVRELGR